MKYINQAKIIYPGLLVAFLLALAAQFISDHYGSPTMLMALLFGMALNCLSHEKNTKVGINFSAKKLLRIGVALLGARISFDMITQLGISTALIVVVAVCFTLCFGLIIGKILNQKTSFSFLTSGSVAICGASAAMAISAILPQKDQNEERLVFTVAGVTVLSTIAMIIYPLIGLYFGLKGEDLGIFLGGTIHDVAQVVGAGYSVDTATGDVSTIVKLMRVAILAPVILIASMIIRANTDHTKVYDRKRSPILPPFIIGFCILVLMNSFGFLPETIASWLIIASKWSLYTAIAAVGMKINLGEIRKVGKTAAIMIISETIFMALLVGGLVKLT